MSKLSFWRTIAIVFIILFVVETTLFIWLLNSSLKEIKKEQICAYNICGEYPSYLYESDLCSCYDSDNYGNLEIIKTEVIN